MLSDDNWRPSAGVQLFQKLDRKRTSPSKRGSGAQRFSPLFGGHPVSVPTGVQKSSFLRIIYIYIYNKKKTFIKRMRRMRRKNKKTGDGLFAGDGTQAGCLKEVSDQIKDIQSMYFAGERCDGKVAC